MSKKIYLITLVLLCNVRLMGQAPGWAWAKSAGGTGDDYGKDIAQDLNGNKYVTGGFNSPGITFGSTTLTNGGVVNFFIVKYDINGNVLWAKGAGGGYHSGMSVVTDANNNVYVAGTYGSFGTTVFGNDTLPNAGSNDIFIVKYDSNGNVIWAKGYGGNLADFPTKICIGSDSNICFTGHFRSNSITFGSTVLNVGGSFAESFIVKCDTAGNVIWVAGSHNGDDVESYSMAADAFGNYYITGFFTGPLTSSVAFGNIALANSGGSGFNPADIFIVKYDSSGDVVWAKRPIAYDSEYGFSIAADPGGNIYVTGFFGGSQIVFGNDTLHSTGNWNIFIAKYDSSGASLWGRSASGTNQNYGGSVATDINGNNYVTGTYKSSTLTFGSTTLNNAGVEDIFIVKHDSSGNLQWAESQGGNSNDVSNNIYVAANNEVYITGNFKSSAIAFGNDTLINVSAGTNGDLFFARTDPVFTAVEINSFPSMSIFPNPSPGEINISSAEIIDQVEIRDMMGRVIYYAEPNAKSVQVQMKSREGPGGIYFVRVRVGTESMVSKVVLER
ncbi:MAG: T9SS type A sorting domain-containing protein [Bacteroidia bacterium]